MKLMLGVMLAVLFAASVGAQDTLNVSGTVQDNAENYHLIDIDFGTTPQSISLSLAINATGGTSGLDVSLVDLDELALNGTATSIDSADDPGTGVINVSLTTPTYSGVHQFIVLVSTDAANGPSPYSGTLTSPDLNAGDMVQTGFQVHVPGPGYFTLLGRSAVFGQDVNAAVTVSRTVQIDFGTTPQAITFWIQGVGFADGEVEVYEVPESGTPTLLGSVSGTGFWEVDDNFTTSTRTGVVTLRMDIIASAASIYAWRIVTPGTVAILAPQGGGSKSKSDGCSTTEHQGLGLMALLAALATFGVVCKRLHETTRPGLLG